MRNCNVMGNIGGHAACSSLLFQAPYLGDFVEKYWRRIRGHHGICTRHRVGHEGRDLSAAEPRSSGDRTATWRRTAFDFDC